MTAAERAAFFDFYKKHASRRLYGFFNDLARSGANNLLLRSFLRKKSSVRCLLVGCSHWANPLDLSRFIRSYNRRVSVEIAAVDVLPDALVEAIQRGVPFVPLLAPAQKTPFCDQSFDILIADGLLNCCCFEQHEPIVRELKRLAGRGSVVLLGLSHTERGDRVVKWAERPIAAYCRPLNAFKTMFRDHGFSFPRSSSIITPFLEGSGIATDNCIAKRRP
jgi:SAM-dependent methyltransferase